MADGVAQLASSTGWDSPAQPQGLPPCPPQPWPGQGEKRETSAFLEEIYSHFSWEFDLLKRVGVEEQGREAVVTDGLRSLVGAVCDLRSDCPPPQKNAHTARRADVLEGSGSLS